MIHPPVKFIVYADAVRKHCSLFSQQNRMHANMHNHHNSNHRFLMISESRGHQLQSRYTTNSEDSQSGISAGSMDRHCPVCLHAAIFPVKTNCGHLFCAPCLISYWKHSCCLEAISCPLCRQKVNVMYHLFHESRSDRKEREVLGHIGDYNKRYSGTPRKISDYLLDAPFFLLLLFRALGNMGGLVWLFLLRVALCGFGAAASFVSPLDAMPGHFSRALGLLDDLVVVFLLLIAIINIHQQMVPERTTRPYTVEHGILSDML